MHAVDHNKVAAVLHFIVSVVYCTCLSLNIMDKILYM